MNHRKDQSIFSGIEKSGIARKGKKSFLATRGFLPVTEEKKEVIVIYDSRMRLQIVSKSKFNLFFSYTVRLISVTTSHDPSDDPLREERSYLGPIPSVNERIKDSRKGLVVSKGDFDTLVARPKLWIEFRVEDKTLVSGGLMGGWGGRNGGARRIRHNKSSGDAEPEFWFGGD